MIHGSASKLAMAALGTLACACARAEIDLSVTAASDYDFRGISQTQGAAAVQLEAGYERPSFFASVFGSPVDFGPFTDGSYEIDLVAGIARATRSGLEWRLAANAYLYPGANGALGDLADDGDDVAATPDYMEISAEVAGERFGVAYWYSPDLYRSGATASYLASNLELPLPRSFGLRLHAGYSFGPYFDSLESVGGDDAEYFDFSVALERSARRVDLALEYVWTSTEPEFQTKIGPLRNDARLIFSVSKSFDLPRSASPKT